MRTQYLNSGVLHDKKPWIELIGNNSAADTTPAIALTLIGIFFVLVAVVTCLEHYTRTLQ
jgi:hypothetical protein